jgi:TrmH family RNA methyltransferase
MLAADASGASLDDEIASGHLAAPTAWMFGNEAHGLSAAHSAVADAVVGVPIYGQAESLNLATAAAVCLYASARAQQRG